MPPSWIQILVVLFVLALPQALLASEAFPPWVCRLIGVLAFHVFVALGCLWLALVPRAILREGAKLLEPEYAAVRGRVVTGIRILVGAFLVFYTWVALMPTVLDLNDLIARSGPPIMTAPARPAGERFAWLKQTILVAGEAGSYQFFYANRRIGSPGIYEMQVLRRARIILDATPLDIAPNGNY